MTTHYHTLGLAPDATLHEIQAAYRRCLSHLRESLRAGEAADPQALDLVRAAWLVLGDPQRRADYDRALTPPAANAITIATDASGTAAEHADAPEGFRFTGRGDEYFMIWIVNLLLTVVTLGIYSAWAKVRREQYFHRHLQLAGDAFDYHARPLAILKGRAVVFVLLAVLSAAEKLSPALYALAVLGFVAALPWLVIRALRFRAHNTSYRGLRFRFTGGYGAAAGVLLGYGLLLVVTFGLTLPLFLQKFRRFTLNHLHFGTAAFSCQVTATAYYRIFAVPALAGFSVVALIGLLMAVLPKSQISALAVFALMLASVPVLMLVGASYLRARMINAVWNTTTLPGGHFTSSLPVAGFVLLQAGNWLAVVLTLGVFWPWAAVRTARFRAEHLALTMSSGLDDFVAGIATESAALGDELADALDLDLGA